MLLLLMLKYREVLLSCWLCRLQGRALLRRRSYDRSSLVPRLLCGSDWGKHPGQVRNLPKTCPVTVLVQCLHPENNQSSSRFLSAFKMCVVLLWSGGAAILTSMCSEIIQCLWNTLDISVSVCLLYVFKGIFPCGWCPKSDTLVWG